MSKPFDFQVGNSAQDGASEFNQRRTVGIKSPGSSRAALRVSRGGLQRSVAARGRKSARIMSRQYPRDSPEPSIGPPFRITGIWPSQALKSISSDGPVLGRQYLFNFPPRLVFRHPPRLVQPGCTFKALALLAGEVGQLSYSGMAGAAGFAAACSNYKYST